MNDRLSEELTQKPHFCLLQAAAEEPHSQRHTRLLNPENSDLILRTVLNPLLQRDPCETRTHQCRRTHVSAHTHTSEQANT